MDNEDKIVIRPASDYYPEILIALGYLKTCSSSEAYQWIRETLPSLKYKSKEIESYLLDKQDPMINFGLAQYGQTSLAFDRLYSAASLELKAALLANSQDISYKHDDVIRDDVAKNMSLLNALISNPFLPEAELVDVLNRQGKFEQLSDEMYEELITGNLYKSPVLKKDDLAKLLNALWEKVKSLEVNEQNADFLHNWFLRVNLSKCTVDFHLALEQITRWQSYRFLADEICKIASANLEAFKIRDDGLMKQYGKRIHLIPQVVEAIKTGTISKDDFISYIRPSLMENKNAWDEVGIDSTRQAYQVSGNSWLFESDYEKAARLHADIDKNYVIKLRQESLDKRLGVLKWLAIAVLTLQAILDWLHYFVQGLVKLSRLRSRTQWHKENTISNSKMRQLTPSLSMAEVLDWLHYFVQGLVKLSRLRSRTQWHKENTISNSKMRQLTPSLSMAEVLLKRREILIFPSVHFIA